ncbi:hypothetical protein VTL71DRAFT_15802 [Oculimacula yallundae]|uniref:2EXR domain-containing protein n=1 Tax=Oculimacula yallundae TaxID=86028 RepID=A0ABR4CCN0_9HELO
MPSIVDLLIALVLLALNNLNMTDLRRLPDLNQELSVQIINPLNTFHRFMELPPELRIIIWRFCMPTGRHFPLANFRLDRPTFLGPRSPITAFICHESRMETMRHFVYLQWHVSRVFGGASVGILLIQNRQSLAILFDPATDILTTTMVVPMNRLLRPGGIYLGELVIRPVGNSFANIRTLEVRPQKWCVSVRNAGGFIDALSLLSGLVDVRFVHTKKNPAHGACASCFITAKTRKNNVVNLLRHFAMRRSARTGVPALLPTATLYEYFEPGQELPAPASNN